MEGFPKFLVIFVQRYFYPCLNKIGTKKPKTKTKNKNKQTNKNTFFWQFLKNTISNQISCEIPFLKSVYFYILYPISFQVTLKKQLSQKVTKLGRLL